MEYNVIDKEFKGGYSITQRNNRFGLFEGVQSHIDYYHDKIHHTTSQTPNIRYEQSIQRAA